MANITISELDLRIMRDTIATHAGLHGFGGDSMASFVNGLSEEILSDLEIVVED